MSTKKTTAAKAATAKAAAPTEFPVISQTASEDGTFKKTTRAIPVPGGVVLQISTTHMKDGVVTACAESTVLVPNAAVESTPEGNKVVGNN